MAFGLLLFAYNQKRKKKYRQHGIIMTVAVVMHLIVIVSWMIGSLAVFFSTTPLDLGSILQLSALVHAALGAIAALAGVWLVGSWRLQVDIQKCFARKRWMLTTITVWSAAMLLGIILYAVLVSS